MRRPSRSTPDTNRITRRQPHQQDPITAMQLTGIHTALVTPLSDDDTVDEAALVALIGDQLSAGIEGLVVAGGTGEGLTLTEREVQRVLAITLEVAGGRIPVTANVSALSTAVAVRNAQKARVAGARIVMLQAPFDAPLNDEEIVGHFAAVAQVGLPIMVYNNVSNGPSLSTDMIARLAAIEGVDYLKDSSSDAARMAEVELKTHGALQVLLGKDSFALFGFLCGAQAAVLGSANAIPRACVLLHHLAVVQEDAAAARALWRTMGPLLGFFEAESYVAAVKLATALHGVPVGDPRLPTLPLARDKHARLKELLDPVEVAGAASAVVGK